MMKFKVKPGFILLSCFLLTAGLGFLKYEYPDQGYFNHGFLLVLLLTGFLRKDGYAIFFGAVSVTIVVSSAAMSSVQTVSFLLNVVLSVFSIITSVVVVVIMKRLYKTLEADSKRLRALFNFTNDGIVLFNQAGQILLANPRAFSMFEYNQDEVIGEQLESLLPDQYKESFVQYREQFEKEKLDGKVEQLNDVLLMRKSGKQFPSDIRLGFYTQRGLLYIVAFIQDLTVQRESEKKMLMQNELLEKITYDIRKMNIELENKVSQRTLILQEALHELERSQQELSEALNKEKELNEIKSRFVSMASHEFRTPLSTVMSSASLIVKYQTTEDQDKREKHIKRIKDSVKHLNDLLEDFLSMGKLDEGRVFTEVVSFDVKDFLNDVFDEMRLILKEGQDIKLNCEGEVLFVTDKRLLKNVLINLLSNAIKFSDPDKPIFVNVDNSGSRLILQVQDSGIGIPEEDLPHLFSTFYRGRNATNIQGTGLGLHIVKRYVNMLEGEITLNSKLNSGTTFNIGLPNLQEQA
jgi:PAS domain S-box-containing protein